MVQSFGPRIIRATKINRGGANDMYHAWQRRRIPRHFLQQRAVDSESQICNRAMHCADRRSSAGAAPPPSVCLLSSRWRIFEFSACWAKEPRFNKSIHFIGIRAQSYEVRSILISSTIHRSWEEIIALRPQIELRAGPRQFSP